jgi:hypothetical protein
MIGSFVSPRIAIAQLRKLDGCAVVAQASIHSTRTFDPEVIQAHPMRDGRESTSDRHPSPADYRASDRRYPIGRGYQPWQQPKAESQDHDDVHQDGALPQIACLFARYGTVTKTKTVLGSHLLPEVRRRCVVVGFRKE